jgi:hypothetical protein
MKALRKQLDALEQRLKEDPNAKDVVKAAKELDQKTKDAEESITGWKIDPHGYSLNFPPALDDQLAMTMALVEARRTARPGSRSLKCSIFWGKNWMLHWRNGERSTRKTWPR